VSIYYLNSLAYPAGIGTAEITLNKISCRYKVRYNFICGLHCVWILRVVVAKPAIQTVWFCMFDASACLLAFYYIFSIAVSDMFF